jgi:MoaA/NifB/PqqE/SkfB family radical SAM enzyme
MVRQGAAALTLARANLGRLNAPLKVNLCVTYRCNYRCRTCNIWRRKPVDELSTDELLAFVAGNRTVQWLDVTGGEIFLRADIDALFDALAASWRRLAIIHFPTNGFLTDRIVASTQRLVGRTPAQVIVTVSVDGDELLNDQIRGVRGGFRRQLATFAALRRIGGARAVLGMTLSRDNVGHVDETFRACARECPDLRLEDFHLNVAQRSAHYYGNETSDHVAAADDLRTELQWYRSRRRPALSPSAWVEHRYLTHLERFLTDGALPMRCHALRSSCFVDPWGTVYPCITYSRPLGSLRETGMRLEPIWRRRETVQLQRQIWDGACPRCWTPCEAYHSILGNVLRPADAPPVRRLPMAEAQP